MRHLILIAPIAVVLAGCTTTTTTHTNSNNATPGQNAAAIDHSKMDHSKMDHAKMTSSAGAAQAPYDLQFIDTMIPHHQGAVDMAKLAASKATTPELKALSRSITMDQEQEIQNMQNWREEWFAGKPQAMNMEMAGMHDSMKGMDMSKLGNAAGIEFDRMFVEQMIPHHEGAVTMAKEALQRSEKPEIKALASAIIASQTAEIEKMKGWLQAWSK